MDVNDLPPPVSVAASGPMRVELKLGRGECNRKGCKEGEVLEKCNHSDNDSKMLPWFLTLSSVGCRRCSVHFLLHRGRLSNQESSEGPNLRRGKHRGQVRPQHSAEAGELLGHVLSQPSEPATMGPSG